MVMQCEQFWPEVSNYIENDLDPSVRVAMDDHLKECARCRSVLDGTRNIILLYGDERLFQMPLGFSGRLRRKLAGNQSAWRQPAFGWLVAAAAMALIVGGVVLANSVSRAHPAILSHMAAPARPLPDGLIVVVAEHGKLFHLAKCEYIHAQGAPVRTMTAQEALREGYAPCVRCLGEYVVKLALDFAKKYGLAT